MAFSTGQAKAVPMDARTLRIALFSGNYNYVRDGANQALNRLVGYLLRQGTQVRTYSPTVETPAFPPTGDLVSVPAVPIPGRPEYRFPLGMWGDVKRDIARYAPNVVHVASPDLASHRAITWARRRDLPVVASVHTRFETYLRYYGMAFAEPAMEAMLRRFYRRCDAILAPSESLAQLLREQRMNYDVGIWTRGIDDRIFHPGRRDLDWRAGAGLPPDVPVIGFVGRLVMEKGLDVFSDTIEALRKRQVRFGTLIVGDGPARGWFQSRLPNAVFVGHQSGEDLGRAVASMDMLFNPSITETFGNVTLEAMACRLPVVAARATGSESIVQDGVTGHLVRPGAIQQYADALQAYLEDAALREGHGQAGLAASGAYRWDAVNQSMLDTYLRVVEQRRTGASPPRRSPIP